MIDLSKLNRLANLTEAQQRKLASIGTGAKPKTKHGQEEWDAEKYNPLEDHVTDEDMPPLR